MTKLFAVFTVILFSVCSVFAQGDTKTSTKTTDKNGVTTTTKTTKKHKKSKMAGTTTTKDVKKVNTTKTPDKK